MENDLNNNPTPTPAVEPVVPTQEAVMPPEEDITQIVKPKGKTDPKKLIIMLVLILVLGAVAVYVNLDTIKALFS